MLLVENEDQIDVSHLQLDYQLFIYLFTKGKK